MNVIKFENYNKNRIKVFLDNEIIFLLYKGDIKKFHIEENCDLSNENYNLILEMLYVRARERALYLLDDSYKTEKQIRDKLKSGWYPQNIIDKVVEYLTQNNFVNDFRYAMLFIDYKSKSKSKRQIIQDLYIKGISASDIELAFEKSNFSDEESLNKIIEKRILKYDLYNKKELQKLYKYLISKGYEYASVKSALSKYM